MKIQYRDSNCKINNVGITAEKITGRGGLTLMLRYLENVGLFNLFDTILGEKRKNKKGAAISSILRQLISFMVDGTNPSISYFDNLKKDEGYAATLEIKTKDLLSSHSIKRFFRKFQNLSESILFRKVLNRLFIWRLHVEQPKRIVLDIDTMVMDNGESNVREGVKPTYKKGVKGFQILNMHLDLVSPLQSE